MTRMRFPSEALEELKKIDPDTPVGKDRLGKVSIVEDICVPSGTKNQRFSPPTIENIQAYISEKSLNVDAEQFSNFYESKGWMVGRNHMKNWRAACNAWNARNNPKASVGKAPSFDPAEIGRRARENDPVL